MMRVLEFIVALIIVAIVGVVGGVIMPGNGHVERTLEIGKDLRQVYDVLDNFHRFPEYSVLGVYDPQLKYQYSGKSFGPGSEVSWASGDAKVGHGMLSIASAEPGFDKIDSTASKAQIVWKIENDWRGGDKHFTMDLERSGHGGKLTKITWAYDVDYGWNLINRYSNLYIHGAPDSFIQFSLNNLQSLLAAVPNVDYGKLDPTIEQTKQIPVLMVSTSSARKDGDDGLNDAVNKAASVIQAAAKKLNVQVTGPTTVFVKNFGDQTVSFDVAAQISSASLNVGGQTQQLTAVGAPTLPGAAAAASAPAAASTSAAPSENAAVGSRDHFGRLVIDSDVRALLLEGGAALKGEASGQVAIVWQLTRDQLKAYAQTHGYRFDDVTNMIYYSKVKQGDNVNTFDQYDVYLPISDAPDQTPEQAAGIKPESLDAPAATGTAAAPASAASSGH